MRLVTVAIVSVSASVMAYLRYRTRTWIAIRVRISIPKMGTIAIGDPSPDRDPNLSLCNGNSFCTIQCSH